MAQQPVELPDEPPAAVSAGVGIAVNRPGATAGSILQDAGTAMYAAKNRYAGAGHA
ncbi:hypothetical protein [Paractinoplanes abujensis]|uniref:GGDEF domain-containing protein n=1 Tax=Paractinoplanes abujensis TaxID=882441 RepID=A0A7W7CRG1_9ACTN|nr:hypothetical protein [Actinoplanes abujensis]MBB4693359.1 GGDEF domain-containing protein [Actinoplanes abujensis]